MHGSKNVKNGELSLAFEYLKVACFKTSGHYCGRRRNSVSDSNKVTVKH